MMTRLCWAPIILARRCSAQLVALSLIGLSAPCADTRSVAALASGAAAVEHGKYDQSLPLLQEAQTALPLISDYPAYLLAAALYEMKQYSGIEDRLRPVWDRTPASPLRAKAVILAANAHIHDGKPKQAIALVEKHLADLTPPQTESLLAHAFGAAAEPARATEHFQRLYLDYPLAEEAADAEAALAQVPPPPPQARLGRCLKLLEGADYTRAHTELQALIPQLTGTLLDTARVKLGAAEFFSKSYGPASIYLASLRVQSPEADAERLYYLFQCARRTDNTAAFPDILAQLERTHSQSLWRLQALLSAGEYYFFYNQVDAYSQVYRACSVSFPANPLAADCYWRPAFIEYLHRGPNTRALLEEFVQRHSSSDRVPNALYFLGRLAEDRSEWGAAKARYLALNTKYPNAYHAGLARVRLNQPAIRESVSPPEVSAWLAQVQFPLHPGVNFTPSALAAVRIERARLLASGGLDDLAESELRYGAKTDGQPNVMALELAELANQRNAPHRGIRCIKQLAPDYLFLPANSAPQRFWKLAFPLPFQASVERYSREFDLDPFIVAALIRQESEFNPAVVSRARAYGLAQVLPSTGRELSRRLGIRPYRANMLFVPEINLRIGIYFLRSLFDRLQGNWEATLASYNAGPNRVARWLTFGDFRDPAEFVEMIPFTETRNYVQIVLRNADIYRRIYGKPGTMSQSEGIK